MEAGHGLRSLFGGDDRGHVRKVRGPEEHAGRADDQSDDDEPEHVEYAQEPGQGTVRGGAGDEFAGDHQRAVAERRSAIAPEWRPRSRAGSEAAGRQQAHFHGEAASRVIAVSGTAELGHLGAGDGDRAGGPEQSIVALFEEGGEAALGGRPQVRLRP